MRRSSQPVAAVATRSGTPATRLLAKMPSSVPVRVDHSYVQSIFHMRYLSKVYRDSLQPEIRKLQQTSNGQSTTSDKLQYPRIARPIFLPRKRTHPAGRKTKLAPRMFLLKSQTLGQFYSSSPSASRGKVQIMVYPQLLLPRFDANSQKPRKPRRGHQPRNPNFAAKF